MRKRVFKNVFCDFHKAILKSKGSLSTIETKKPIRNKAH
ncbi:hypothetical protein LEP1GSC052_2570 [Leptospira kmetyi serovar Malaysia str. Bejo-Iso9]|nr:hypothetical protein LEP1GSC052_2570 [Leptospira kmetyi serovar Malaysia str. Bejo-Iso9]